jgi:FixJ family two-component response regulator
VEIYRANVMSKMRADSLSELIRMTLTSGAA